LLTLLTDDYQVVKAIVKPEKNKDYQFRMPRIRPIKFGVHTLSYNNIYYEVYCLIKYHSDYSYLLLGIFHGL